MYCYIILLVFGLIILVRGRVLLTRTKEVRGWPARLIGVMLILYLPLIVLAGAVAGVIFAAQGMDVKNKDFELIGPLIAIAMFVLCFLAIIVIAIAYAEPIRRFPSKDERVELDIPDEYRDRFRSEQADPSRPHTGSEDITKRPPPPGRPDDRIIE